VVGDAVLLVVAGFCAIAMGLGPPFCLFVVGLVGVGGFRARRHTWWGLAMTAASLMAGIGVISGLGVMLIVKLWVAVFFTVAVLRVAARRRLPGNDEL
jgi:hypothetical protein